MQNNGSCLNEECTKTIEDMFNLLKEANEKYDSLPDCIKNITPRTQNLNFETSLGYSLMKCKNLAYSFAAEFGIKL